MSSLFFKRRRLLVDRFQYRLIWVSVIHFGLVLSVFLVSMLLPLMLKLDDPSATYLERQRVAEVLLFFDEQLWIPLGAVFLLLAVHSLLVSHRIAGPLFRFQRVFESVAGGDFGVRANIRKHDYLHTHAKSLNEMIESLERRRQGLEGQALQVKEEAAQLKQAAGPGAVAEIKKGAERIESQVEGLLGQLAGGAKKA